VTQETHTLRIRVARVAALLVLYRALAPTPVAAPDAPPESAASEGGLRASANPLLFE